MTPATRSIGSAAITLVIFAVLGRAQLPPVPAPPENPITANKAVLGKILFWDEQLASDNTVACGTCHQPAAGGGDPRLGRNPGLDATFNTADDTFGSPGVVRSDASDRYKPDPIFGLDVQVTPRHSSDYTMGAYAAELFWDGRAASQFVDPQTQRVSIARGGALESQSVGPPVSDGEMAHEARDWNAIAQKLQVVKPLKLASNLPPDVAAALAANATYPALFNAAFGSTAITSERIAFALATYERTLVPDRTPWDRNTLTPNQVAGRDLFFGKAGCAGVECHEPPFFTDFDFRNTGVRPVAEDLGRMKVTNLSSDRGRFKIPSLRNVGLRKRFMHNGGMTTLDEVLAFYNRGGDSSDNRDARVHPLNLTALQQSQIVDFLLNGLTDPRMAAELPPFDRPKLFAETNPPGSFLYGDESAGTGGAVPLALAQVPANLPNLDFKLGVARALGGSFGLLALSAGAAPTGLKVQGIPINVAPDRIVFMIFAGALGGTGPGAGFGTVQFPIPDDQSLAGASVFTQWFVVDAAAPGGFSATKGARQRLF